jgi:hypothetical protein
MKVKNISHGWFGRNVRIGVCLITLLIRKSNGQ